MVALEQELSQAETLEVTFAEIRQVLQDFPVVWDALEHEERQEMLRLLIEHLNLGSLASSPCLRFTSPDPE